MKKLIITEGADDKKFFIGLLSYLRVAGVEVVEINPKQKGRGSKANLFNIDDISSAINAETEELESKILIICDADFEEEGVDLSGFTASKSAAEKILEVLKNNKEHQEQNKNKKIEFFIIPNNEIDGNLESLYLNCLAIDQSSMKCVEDYLKCLSKKISLQQNPKMKAFSLLAPIGLKDAVHKVGFAACLDEKNKKHREGYWDFESPALKPLSDFLKNYFN
jgi:hypothetical protein